jgi:hypothetical protein
MHKKMCPGCYGLGYVYAPANHDGSLLSMVLHNRCGGTGNIPSLTGREARWLVQ